MLIALLAETAAERNFALDLVVVLAMAALVALAFNRFRLPSIPGYIIAGALIGPHAFQIIRTAGRVEEIGHLSTILLLFILGLELDMARVKKGLFSIVGGTTLATAIMVLLAWGLAYLFVGSVPVALGIALAMGFTATAAPIRMMEQRRELHTTYGRLAFGMCLFQDLLAVVALAVIPFLALWNGTAVNQEETTPLQALRAGGIAVAGIALLLLFGRFVLPKILREASRYGGEVMIVVSAAMALAGAMYTAWLGFSPEMGAFLGGFMLASTPFRFQVSGQLIPMRDLFLAVFFTAVGLAVPLRDVASSWWVVLLGLLGLAFVRLVGIPLASWALGASLRVGVLAAVTLVAAGEFTLIILAKGRQEGLFTEEYVAQAVAVVAFSILWSPLIAALGRRVAPRLESVRNAPWVQRSMLREEPAAVDGVADAQGDKFKVIIAGFGPVGRAVADALQPEGVDITVVELNPNTVQRQVLLGRKIVYGDASNPEVLHSAGIEHADAVVLTMPDEEAMLRACRTVRMLKKDVFLAARANALSKGLMAMQLGADHAVVEEMATAEAMGKEVLLKVKDRMAGADTGPRLYEFQ
ncbi:MAG TPA: cation:proton antiporter [Phycisphaerales bacterium]|nr:cation:proton antiporter [Phycisphaerales bacterium]